MRNLKFSMPIRLVSLVVALLLLISIFPMSIFATDKDVAAVNADIDAVPVGEVADVTDDGTITIYFQNNWMWPDANIYYWGSKTATNPSWTGIALTEAVATTEEGYTIYKFELPADVEGFLFNGTGENGFEQSDDIKDGWYDGICYYMTYDADTNTKPCGSYEYVVVEPTPPSIFESITYTDSKGGTLTPDNNVLPWVNDEVMISIKVKENSGISKVTVDGEEATKNGDLYTYIAKNSNSAKIFAIVATDADGNVIAQETTDRIQIDKTDPSIEEIKYYKGGKELDQNDLNNGYFHWTNADITVKFKVTDLAINQQEVKVNGKIATSSEDGIYSYTFSEDCNGTFKISATDEAGNNTEVDTIGISIDKTAPEIYDVKYYAGKEELTPEKGVLPWTNKEVTVKFKIFEAPAENCGSGIVNDSVTVDGKSKGITLTDGVYSYTETVKDEMNFEKILPIFVQDCAGNQGTVDTSEIRIDKIKPVISEITYTDSDGNTLTPDKEGNLPWTNKNVTASFTVTDEDSGINVVEIGDTKLTTPTPDKNGVYSYTYTFDAAENSVLEVEKMAITATDNAGNSAGADENNTAKVRIENIAPVAEAYIFPISAKDVLNFLSFGIYGNSDEVQVTVRAYDEHSDIKEVYLYYKDGTQVDSPVVNEQLEKLGTSRRYVTFTLSGVYVDLRAVAVDNAGNISDGLNFSNGKKYFSEATDDLAELFGASFDEANFDQASFDECTPGEIVVSKEQPNIKFTPLFPKDEDGNITGKVVKIDKVDWYNCAVSMKTEIEALNTKLKEAHITRDASVDDYDYDEKFDFTKEATTKYSDTFNAAGDGYNKITVTAQSNNTQSSTGSYEYYIDTTAPVIKEIKYTDGKGNKLSGSEELSWVDSNVTVDFTVEEQGSGIKVVRISDTELTPVSVENGVYSYSYTIDVDDADTFADGFTIYAEDNVGFTDRENTSTIHIDKINPVISDVNYTDDKGNVLDPAEDLAWINKDVIVEFTVKEKGSGIKVVKIGDAELTPVSENNGIYRYSYTVKVADADSFVGDFVICAEDNVGFTDEETTSNIRIDKIKPVVETFTFEKTAETVISFLTFGIYSCEDIKVTVKATDEVDSSGIKSIALYDGETLIDSKAYDGTSSDISEVFTLAEGRYTNINAVVKDSANNSSGKTDMDNNNAYASQDEVYQIASPDEIVVSGEQAEITFAPDSDVIDIDGEDWYNCPVSVKTDIDALNT
ncbi:MAG: hypothetical protein IJO20_08035, partial [Ruminococcus sp.]|nr:hypothetical protein [Ruminococcus sp.]